MQAFAGKTDLPLAWAKQEKWRSFHWHRRAVADRLTSTQAQIQGFELTHPNIYPTYECWSMRRGQILQNQSCRISMTQDNNSEDPVLIE